MYEYKLAYRFFNDEIEGFKGISLTSRESAKKDALRQITRKLEIIDRTNAGQIFDHTRVIEDENSLTKAELKLVRADWKTNIRY